MKFKNEKHVEEGQEARILTITDKDMDIMEARIFVDDRPQVIISCGNFEPRISPTTL